MKKILPIKLILAFFILGSSFSVSNAQTDTDVHSYSDVYLTKMEVGGESVEADANEIFQYKEGSKKPIYVANAYGKTTQFTVEKEICRNIFSYKNTNIAIDGFRLPDGRSGKLVLNKTRPIYDQNTKFYMGGKRVEAPIVNSYNGYISGIEGSEVFMTSYKGEMTGSVNTGDGNHYNIGRIVLENATQSPNEDIYIIKGNDTDLQGDLGYKFCGVSDDEIEAVSDRYLKEKDIETVKNATGLIEVQIIAVGGYDYLRIALSREALYPFANSDDDFVEWANNPDTQADYLEGMERATAYMLSVMEMSSRIYERQTSTTFKLNQVRQEDYTDPLYDLMVKTNRVDAQVKLIALGDYWKTKTSPSDYRNYVVLFTDHRSDGSNILGIANGGEPMVGNYCNLDRGYCVVGVNYNFRSINYNTAGDVHTTTHEIGHLCGVPHTHNSYFFNSNPQPSVRDTCVTRGNGGGATAGDAFVSNAALRSPKPGPLNPDTYGTIMSYCHLGGEVRANFHPYIAQSMIKVAAEKANCLDNPEEPIVRLTNFWGGETITPGSRNITWISHGVTQIDIRYSVDGGAEWIPLASGFNTSFGRVQWDVPNIETDNLLVEIYESGKPRDVNSSTYDVSFAPTSVQNVFVAFTAPVNEEKISNKIDYDLMWESNLVDTYTLEYSTDDTQTWIPITELTTNRFSLDAPDDYEGVAYLRVADKSRPQYNDVIEIELGNPDGMIVLPVEGYESAEQREKLSFEFDAEFVDEVTFEFSTDGGQSYNNVQVIGTARIPAIERFYDWTQYSTRNGGPNNDFRIRMMAYNPDGDNIFLDEVTIQIIPGVNSVDPKKLNSDMFKISSLYPNPVSGNFNFRVENTIHKGDVLISLYDMKGTLVKEQRNTVSGDFSVDMDLSDSAMGMYNLVVTTGEYTATSKISVKR
ncbi:MAG: hypothetical protein Kapaf2KO_16720 [Candidatus Kapaibacteriales bacterium]